MRRVLVACWALSCLASEAPKHTPPESEIPVAVIIDFEQPFSPVCLEEMQRELESIMEPASLYIQWRILSDAVGKEIFNHLVVVRFRGDCRGEELRHTPPVTGALGLTHISEGEILPFTEVDCNRVRNFIHDELIGEPFPRMERLLGRALGRVLAHELYHVLAETAQHARQGIAKKVLTADELVSSRLEFEPGQSEIMRMRLAPQRGATQSEAAGQ